VNIVNAGCYLPALSGQWQTEQLQAVQSSGSAISVDVLVRNENDPYLYFLDISNGLKGAHQSTRKLWSLHSQ
jgi:hypothetical protein